MYDTLWNVCLQNRNAPELSEKNSHAWLRHSKQSLKCVSVILFTDEKIFTVTTPKNPQNDRLYAYPSTKKERHHKWQNAYVHGNVQSLMTSVGEQQVADITPVWYLSITA